MLLPDLSMLLTAMGDAQYIPVAAGVIGLASAVATIYPPTWKGAAILHKFALLVGNAAPANPAVPPPTSSSK